MKENISFVITKRADVLIRNDANVNRLKAGLEIELIQVDTSMALRIDSASFAALTHLGVI